MNKNLAKLLTRVSRTLIFATYCVEKECQFKIEKAGFLGKDVILHGALLFIQSIQESLNREVGIDSTVGIIEQDLQDF